MLHIFRAVVFHTPVFISEHCTQKFRFWRCLLLPFTLIFIYLGVNWWCLHILLNQAATLSFISFSLILLKLWTIFVCLAFIYLTLYIFGAASVFIFNCVVARNNNLCVSLIIYVTRSQYICIQKICATFIYNWPTTLYWFTHLLSASLIYRPCIRP